MLCNCEGALLPEPPSEMKFKQSTRKPACSHRAQLHGRFKGAVLHWLLEVHEPLT